MSNYLDHLRSLDELHRVIDGRHHSGIKEAVTGFVTDVEASVAAIVKNRENFVAVIHSEAKALCEEINAKAADTVAEIKM